jgi:hypothetical protein
MMKVEDEERRPTVGGGILMDFVKRAQEFPHLSV